jgi:hypothetical protein
LGRGYSIPGLFVSAEGGKEPVTEGYVITEDSKIERKRTAKAITKIKKAGKIFFI